MCIALVSNDLILSLFTTLVTQMAMTSFILWVASAPHVIDMHNDVYVCVNIRIYIYTFLATIFVTNSNWSSGWGNQNLRNGNYLSICDTDIKTHSFL